MVKKMAREAGSPSQFPPSVVLCARKTQISQPHTVSPAKPLSQEYTEEISGSQNKVLFVYENLSLFFKNGEVFKTQTFIFPGKANVQRKKIRRQLQHGVKAADIDKERPGNSTGQAGRSGAACRRCGSLGVSGSQVLHSGSRQPFSSVLPPSLSGGCGPPRRAAKSGQPRLPASRTPSSWGGKWSFA